MFCRNEAIRFSSTYLFGKILYQAAEKFCPKKLRGPNVGALLPTEIGTPNRCSRRPRHYLLLVPKNGNASHPPGATQIKYKYM